MSNTRKSRFAVSAQQPQAFITEDGETLWQVPNKAVQRLLQAGIAAERESRRRAVRRRMEKASKRRNRSK